MKVFDIKNSSAIAKISFDEEQQFVGIAFTSNSDKEYFYYCENIETVMSQILKTEEDGGSIGKLINMFRKDGTLEEIIV